MLHTKMEGKRPRARLRTKWEKYRNKSGKLGTEYKKTGSGRIKTTGDFFLIVIPYIWRRLKNDDI